METKLAMRSPGQPRNRNCSPGQAKHQYGPPSRPENQNCSEKGIVASICHKIVAEDVPEMHHQGDFW